MWFAFAADRLVVREVDEAIDIPLVAGLEDLGLVVGGAVTISACSTARDCWALDSGR
jgi:hypothetical protein